MIYQDVVIGSGFASLGAILGLKNKRKNFVIITGKINYSNNNKKVINLPTRNFNKYKKNIFQSLTLNKIEIDIKNNFISYLGFGGLSNIWGKIFNLDIIGNTKIINEILIFLKLNKLKEIQLHKKLTVYKANEQNVNFNNIFDNFNKKKFL
jgi:hypothetical protein